MKNELTEEIRHMLEQQCTGRSLDDEEDFKAVMEVVNAAVERWIDNRCLGCN